MKCQSFQSSAKLVLRKPINVKYYPRTDSISLSSSSKWYGKSIPPQKSNKLIDRFIERSISQISTTAKGCKSVYPGNIVADMKGRRGINSIKKQ